MNLGRPAKSPCNSKLDLAAHERFEVNSPDVVQDTIDGESVIVNLRTGHYYSLEKSGAAMWQMIEKHFSLNEIVQSMHRLYTSDNGAIEEAVTQLTAELQKEELIRPTQVLPVDLTERKEGSVTLEDKESFEFPFLQKYTDMQDILLLDPIHDVDESGWPNIKIDKVE